MKRQSSVQFSSVAQSCLTLCNPMNCSIPGLPVHHQRNTAQMKEQTRNTEVQIKGEEIGKLPEKEFSIMMVKMIKNLENKMKKMQESINKDLEELKNKHRDKQHNY